MNNISRFNLQTSVAGIFGLELRSGLGFVVELQFWNAVSVTEAPPLPGETALVSNVDLQQTLEYSKSHYISRNSDWSQLIRCADLILWLQSAIEVLRSSSTSYLSVLTVWYVVWYCTPRVWLIHLGATDASIWGPRSYFELVFKKGLVLSQHWLCGVEL